MKPIKEQQKALAKQALLEKLKTLKLKSQPSEQSQNIQTKNKNQQEKDNSSLQEEQIDCKIQEEAAGKKDANENVDDEMEDDVFFKLQAISNQQERKPNQNLVAEEGEWEVKHEEDEQIQDEEKPEEEGEIFDEKEFEKIAQQTRTRTYYEFHENYRKEDIYDPVIPGFSNPSGMPDIPSEMLEGKTVIPRKPWIYYGPQNIPKSECPKITEEDFPRIFRQAKKKKPPTNMLRRTRGRRRKQVPSEDYISEVSEQYSSNNPDITNSIDPSNDTDLVSDFKSKFDGRSENSMIHQVEEPDSFSESERLSLSISSLSSPKEHDIYFSEQEFSQDRSRSRKYSRNIEKKQEESEESEKQLRSKRKTRKGRPTKGKGKKALKEEEIKSEEEEISHQQSNSLSQNARRIAQRLRKSKK